MNDKSPPVRVAFLSGLVEYQDGAGEAIVMPADEPHAVKAVRRFKMSLTMIRS
jgi:quercetin dioxygenase-like cupin family protein